jgi:preprotein translocase subunit SecE
MTSMANPLQFLQQVRSEAGKISWPSRREVLVTTGMVLVMAALTSAFFALVDWVIRMGVGAIIG